MILCDAPGCIRGILRPMQTSAFGNPCPICQGAGQLRLVDVARILDEDEAMVRRLMRPHRKMRVKTCQRILDKLAEVLGWTKIEL
jgi:excinuclease UvrABC ATPase subunit